MVAGLFLAGWLLLVIGWLVLATDRAEDCWRRRRKTVWVKAPPPCPHADTVVVEGPWNRGIEPLALLCLDCDEIAEYL